MTCTAGACVCPGQLKACNGACVDTKTDPANCGTCGNVCGSDQACSNGTCVCKTRPGYFYSLSGSVGTCRRGTTITWALLYGKRFRMVKERGLRWTTRFLRSAASPSSAG